MILLLLLLTVNDDWMTKNDFRMKVDMPPPLIIEYPYCLLSYLCLPFLTVN